MTSQQELSSLLALWSAIAEEYAATRNHLLLDCLSGIKKAYEELSAKNRAEDLGLPESTKSPAIMVRIRFSKE
jgi:hypothetical protein